MLECKTLVYNYKRDITATRLSLLRFLKFILWHSLTVTNRFCDSNFHFRLLSPSAISNLVHVLLHHLRSSLSHRIVFPFYFLFILCAFHTVCVSVFYSPSFFLCSLS
ncbi:hypothetical protein RJT34_25484 [Clitoria ternatea]|uniref:Uncharacterized protein n=1 Tax=Clitoria ternatea TaxID=43366 RepID=A0AAN9IK16_CLITE